MGKEGVHGDMGDERARRRGDRPRGKGEIERDNSRLPALLLPALSHPSPPPLSLFVASVAAPPAPALLRPLPLRCLSDPNRAASRAPFLRAIRAPPHPVARNIRFQGQWRARRTLRSQSLANLGWPSRAGSAIISSRSSSNTLRKSCNGKRGAEYQYASEGRTRGSQTQPNRSPQLPPLGARPNSPHLARRGPLRFGGRCRGRDRGRRHPRAQGAPGERRCLAQSSRTQHQFAKGTGARPYPAGVDAARDAPAWGGGGWGLRARCAGAARAPRPPGARPAEPGGPRRAARGEG